MTTNAFTRDKCSGANLESIGQYDYELTAHRSHTWEHVDTGLRVEMSKRAGMRDGYGNVDTGYTALVRDADGTFVEELVGVGAYLPTKAETYAIVRDWIEAHPEGHA